MRSVVIALLMITLMSGCSAFKEPNEVDKIEVWEADFPETIYWSEDVEDWKFSVYGKTYAYFIFMCHYTDDDDGVWHLCRPENLKENIQQE